MSKAEQSIFVNRFAAHHERGLKTMLGSCHLKLI